MVFLLHILNPHEIFLKHQQTFRFLLAIGGDGGHRGIAAGIADHGIVPGALHAELEGLALGGVDGHVHMAQADIAAAAAAAAAARIGIHGGDADDALLNDAARGGGHLGGALVDGGDGAVFIHGGYVGILGDPDDIDLCTRGGNGGLDGILLTHGEQGEVRTAQGDGIHHRFGGGRRRGRCGGRGSGIRFAGQGGRRGIRAVHHMHAAGRCGGRGLGCAAGFRFLILQGRGDEDDGSGDDGKQHHGADDHLPAGAAFHS